MTSTDAKITQNLCYLNDAQEVVYQICARDTRMEACRGTGKTDGALAFYMLRCVQSMDRGAGLFLGNSIKQVFGKTVPVIIASWLRNFGLLEGVHFIRGHAPAKMEFREPIVKPKNWENAIHFYNGFVYYMTSLEVKATANGMSVCSIAADESRYLNVNKVKEEIMPTLRGLVYEHPGFDERINPLYKSTMFVSDPALTVRQAWMEKEAKLETVEIIEAISIMLAQLEVCPDLAVVPQFIAKLQRLRCKAFAYFNFSTLENVDILGRDYIKKMERDLPTLMFNISILGLKKGKTKDGYYSAFDIETHGYTPQSCPAMDNLHKVFVATKERAGRMERIEYETTDLNTLQKLNDCTKDGDIMLGKPLRIAFDYNANINCVATGQTYRYEGSDSLMVLSSFFVKNDEKLHDLCKQWHRYYAPHQKSCRDVYFYYDSTAKQGGSYAIADVETTRFYYIVREFLKSKGWNVIEVYMGSPMRHNEKYQFINDVLVGRQDPFLRINKENNEFLITAIEHAEVRMGRNGFEKDKSGEKYKESDESGSAGSIPYEERTDITDAMDTLLIGVRFFNSNMMGIGMPKRG